jgi:hypothetical protein
MSISKKKILEGYIEWELRDPKGRIVKRGKQRVRSFVKAWLQILYLHFNSTSLSVIDISGTSRTVGYNLTPAISLAGGSGVTNYGIVVGSSDTPVTRDDYKLGSQILHGTGTGQLTYGAVSIDAPVAYGTGYLIRVVRVFTNNSGADITVKEIGIYSYSTSYYFCIIRDVLTTPVTIPNGYSWTVRYNFYFVV